MCRFGYQYGKHGTKDRDELEAAYEAFKIGALIHDTLIKMGMIQEQLAEKVGTSKSYISQFENNIKEARISTVQKIIELGLGGRLELKLTTYKYHSRGNRQWNCPRMG